MWLEITSKIMEMEKKEKKQGLVIEFAQPSSSVIFQRWVDSDAHLLYKPLTNWILAGPALMIPAGFLFLLLLRGEVSLVLTALDNSQTSLWTAFVLIRGCWF